MQPSVPLFTVPTHLFSVFQYFSQLFLCVLCSLYNVHTVYNLYLMGPFWEQSEKTRGESSSYKPIWSIFTAAVSYRKQSEPIAWNRACGAIWGAVPEDQRRV